MHLEPSEKAMYKRLDRLEYILFLLPICMAGGIIIAALGIINHWNILIGCSIFFTVILVAALGVYCQILRQSIMPLKGCHLETQKNLLRIYQPYRLQKYESGQIFFDEIISLVKGKKGGFYIHIVPEGKSCIDCEGRRIGTCIFISPLGYEKEEMERVYQTIKERIPASSTVYEK